MHADDVRNILHHRKKRKVPMLQGDGSKHLPTDWPEPKPASWDDLHMRASNNVMLFKKMLALTTHLLSLDGGDANCEISGGEARATRIVIRHNDRRVTTGPNFFLLPTST